MSEQTQGLARADSAAIIVQPALTAALGPNGASLPLNVALNDYPFPKAQLSRNRREQQAFWCALQIHLS